MDANRAVGPLAIQSQVERLIGRGSFGYVVSACVGPSRHAPMVRHGRVCECLWLEMTLSLGMFLEIQVAGISLCKSSETRNKER